MDQRVYLNFILKCDIFSFASFKYLEFAFLELVQNQKRKYVNLYKYRPNIYIKCNHKMKSIWILKLPILYQWY